MGTHDDRSGTGPRPSPPHGGNGNSKLEGAELEDAIAGLGSGWSYQDQSLCKDFAFESFSESADFVAALGELSDDLEGHSPASVILRGNGVRLCLSTVSVQGVSEADIDFAQLADLLVDGAMADAVTSRYLDEVTA